MNRKVLGATGALIAVAVWAVAGCQTYDFEPVQPMSISQTTQERVIQARGARPELMLLVDKSGSMDLPVDPSDPDCKTGGVECGHKGEVGSFPCDTSVCPTRWSELQKAMGSFLPDAGNLARMGLAVFPGGTASTLFAPGCTQPTTPIFSGGPQGVTIELPQGADIPLELEGQAQLIKTTLGNILSTNSPGANGTGGGTPTGPALRMLADYSPLVDSNRTKLVLLLTDGIPNCNLSNPHRYDVDPVACACTLDPVRCGALFDAGYPTAGCLDQDNSVSAVTALRAKNVSTIVLGFGAETAAPTAAASLNAMATAGGYGRNCQGSNVCDVSESCDPGTHLCQRRYFQAANAAELQAELAKISDLVLQNPCTYELDAQPETSAFLLVTFQGKRVTASSSTWNLTSDGKVQFFGAYCDELKASTPQNPVNVTFRIVQAL